METKGFCQFESIINVLVSYFLFIWIPMLWVYGYYKYFYSYSAGIDFRRQILTPKVDHRTVRFKIVHISGLLQLKNNVLNMLKKCSMASLVLYCVFFAF